MTLTICPTCSMDLPDESDLCSMCAETFAGNCPHVRYEECDECAARIDPCPMGCGRTTDDVYGGPCSKCWEASP